MAIDYAALKIELQTDPSSLGYSATVTSGNDIGTAATINLVRGGAAFALQLPTLLATDVQACLDPTEFNALSATALSQLNVMLAGGVVNVASANVRSIFQNIFGSAPTTKGAIVAAVKRQGSRAEVLFGLGAVLAASDIAKALRG